MVRGDYHKGSDVDLLVDAPPRTSALALCGLSIDAEPLLARPVDAVTEGCLSHSIRECVIREAMRLLIGPTAISFSWNMWLSASSASQAIQAVRESDS